LAFFEIHYSTSAKDIYVLPMDGESKIPVVVTNFNEHSPSFSPDGRWLVYVSDESGEDEIYMQAYPGPGRKWSISTEGGQEPLWSADGRELYCRNGDQIMVVTIDTGEDIAVGKPMPLFEAPFTSVRSTLYGYHVSPDGRMFAIVKRSDGSKPAEFHFVLNWFEELKRIAPTN
jgi:serine/threonine-protein kinase